MTSFVISREVVKLGTIEVAVEGQLGCVRAVDGLREGLVEGVVGVVERCP